MSDADKLFPKTYKCPVCENPFKNLTLRQGRARMESTDIDLKVNYKGIEPLKYDVIMCPICGYASLERYFERVSTFQREKIIEEISQKFNEKVKDKGEFSYDEAIIRYRHAFNTSRVRMAKDSEMGLLCLKNGWLYRSYARSIEGDDDEALKKRKELELREKAFLGNALNYLTKARAGEHPPICGMDDTTLDCLLAGLCVELGKFDEAKKYMGNVLQNRSATKSVKDKIITMKEYINENTVAEE